jgi:hypothetical protein
MWLFNLPFSGKMEIEERVSCLYGYKVNSMEGNWLKICNVSAADRER